MPRRSRKLKKRLKRNEFYCVSCQAKRIIRSAGDICLDEDKNCRPRLYSECTTCGNGLFKYIKFKDIDTLEKKYGWC